MESSRINFISKIRTLLSTEGLGIVKILKLVDIFGSVDNLFEIDSYHISQNKNITSHLSNVLFKSRNNFKKLKNLVENEIDQMEKLGASIITYWDKEYPKQLRNIYYPPLLLYVLGSLRESDSQSIAIIGTRSATDYGKTIANSFTKALVEQNITIISGMARGIDSIAHKTTIKNNGRTIAIIGSGLDVIYPP